VPNDAVTAGNTPPAHYLVISKPNPFVAVVLGSIVLAIQTVLVNPPHMGVPSTKFPSLHPKRPTSLALTLKA